MKKLVISAVVVMSLTIATFAQDLSAGNSAEEKDVAFDHLFVTLYGGEIYPWGDLQDAVGNTFYGGAGIRYTYWKDVDGFVTMDYAYFKPEMDNEIVYGIHQVNGKLGLSWHGAWIKPLELGVGFQCVWARADYDENSIDEESFKQEAGGTLVDNETEFGWFFRLNLPVWTTENYRVGFNAHWEELWTLPERSNMMTFGVYVERRIW